MVGNVSGRPVSPSPLQPVAILLIIIESPEGTEKEATWQFLLLPCNLPSRSKHLMRNLVNDQDIMMIHPASSNTV